MGEGACCQLELLKYNWNEWGGQNEYRSSVECKLIRRLARLHDPWSRVFVRSTRSTKLEWEFRAGM